MEILSFLPVDQLLRINSASWRLYRASQLIYEPIRRPYPSRNLGRIRIVGHGRELEFICAEFIFENAVSTEFNGPTLYKRTILSKNITRRDAESEFLHLFSSINYPRRALWSLPRYYMESDDSDDNILYRNLPSTKPPSNVCLIGPIMIGVCTQEHTREIHENNVNILFY